MCKPLTLRPHHVLCISHFIGSGYNEHFVRNMTEVISILNNDNPDVTLVVGADAICCACPHAIQMGCDQQEKVVRYDTACLTLCGLREGDTLQWQQLCRLARNRILDTGRLAEVCGDCGWYALCVDGIPKP